MDSVIKSGFSRAIATIVIIGVVLGVARWLGDGASLTDPQWFTNATAKVQALMDWFARQAESAF